MTGLVQVSTTTDSQESATTLARSAVELRLAASAQIYGPVASVFWHLGELDAGEEWQVLLRTTEDRYPQLEAHLLKQHPWDNPEVTAVALTASSPRYGEWVRRATTEPE